MARYPQHIREVVDGILGIVKLPVENVEVGLIPIDEEDFTVRIWGHVDDRGSFTYKVTTNNLNNRPIPTPMQSYDLFLQENIQ